MQLFTHTIFKEQNLCLITFDVTECDMRTMVLEVDRVVLDSPDWVPGMYVLYDMRSLKKITSFDYQEAWSIGTHEMVPFRQKYGDGKRALVASETAVYGQLRMWVMTLSTDERARVCHDLEEAFEWLEIDDPSAIGF